ncbi:hypothetical protein V1224_04605 [Lachnospiraceae bacterium JLR.KK008]
MDRTFHVTLQEEEYVEYLSCQISYSKMMRGYRWFLLTSVPALLVTGVLILKIKSWLFVSSIIALAVVWVLYGASAVWRRYIRGKIRKKFLPRMNVKEFKEVTYHFGEREIEYSDKNKKTKIAYSDIVTMLPLKSQFAFCYPGGTILLPYRVFKEEEDMKQFIKEYEEFRKKG